MPFADVELRELTLYFYLWLTQAMIRSWKSAENINFIFVCKYSTCIKGMAKAV